MPIAVTKDVVVRSALLLPIRNANALAAIGPHPARQLIAKLMRDELLQAADRATGLRLVRIKLDQQMSMLRRYRHRKQTPRCILQMRHDPEPDLRAKFRIKNYALPPTA